MSVRVAIVGATGYTGSELMRLLLGHRDVDLVAVTSRGASGRPVAALFPHLAASDLRFDTPQVDRLAECDLVFFATPNGVAMEQVPALLAGGTRVVDLSADFRLRDAELWQRWYGQPHASPELLGRAVYGLPEISRSAIRNADLVANPGCYPTAVALGALPLIERGLLADRRLIVDAKSGVSGAGRTLRTNLLYAEVEENFKAYGVFAHRHHPEIVQTLDAVGDGAHDLVFVPHLVPMNRGILATLHLRVGDSAGDLQAMYESRYADEPFVQVMAPGSHPETRHVSGTNLCQIAVHQDGAHVVVLSVIDNLVKGAAGQAIQNMNLMLGLPESAGLDLIARLP